MTQEELQKHILEGVETKLPINYKFSKEAKKIVKLELLDAMCKKAVTGGGGWGAFGGKLVDAGGMLTLAALALLAGGGLGLGRVTPGAQHIGKMLDHTSGREKTKQDKILSVANREVLTRERDALKQLREVLQA